MKMKLSKAARAINAGTASVVLALAIAARVVLLSLKDESHPWKPTVNQFTRVL